VTGGPLNQPIYSGGGLSSEIPYRFPVALNGRPYMLDLGLEDRDLRFSQQTVQVLRAQADTGAQTGEQSINPEGLWRRTQDSWHRGAGQTYRDRDQSDVARFRSSKGIDPWTKWALTLLPDTTAALASSATNLPLAVAGSHLYVGDGQVLRRTTDLAGWTAVSGTPASSVAALASHGATVYAAYGSNGLWSTPRGGGSATQYTTQACTLVRYVLGRLIVANGPTVWNFTASGAAPAALLDHPNADWTWVDAAAGPAHIYLAGFSGDKSLIYRTSIKADGTALDAPVVAGPLPDGEIVRSIQGYLGFLLVGTDRGLRVAQIEGDGSLTFGARIPTGRAVLCFEPQDRFVWYGLSNYDSSSSGLGRLDLSESTAPLVPAYASDLMAAAQGDVPAVVTFNGERVFTVKGSGVWRQSTSLVPSGTLTTGVLSYGLVDPKVALFLDIRHQLLAGKVVMGLAADGGGFAQVGVSERQNTTSPGTGLACNQARGEAFEVQVRLERSASVISRGPEFNRFTLRVNPAPPRTSIFTVPLLLHRTNEAWSEDVHVDVAAERQAIALLYQSQAVVTYQDGSGSHLVTVQDALWLPEQPIGDGGFNGTLVVRLKEITQ
jgi:hypothetical protein